MLPIVLGSGPLADAMRRQIEADPDAYRPETWSMSPAGICPCCEAKVFRCTTRHTGWEPGFATLNHRIHPAFNAETKQPDPAGTIVGCCCVAPNWGPKHSDPKALEKEARRLKRRRKKS